MVTSDPIAAPSGSRRPENGSGLPFCPPTPPGLDPDDLDALSEEDLVALANSSHRQFMGLIQTAVARHARLAGAALNLMKRRIPHRKWEAWVRENFRGSPETARVYMRIARGWPTLVELGYDSEDGATLQELRRALTELDKRTAPRQKVDDGPPENNTPPPPAPPKKVEVFVSAETYPEVVSMLDELGERFGQDNPSDTILELIRWCYERGVTRD